jgi:hypothetical protein
MAEHDSDSDFVTTRRKFIKTAGLGVVPTATPKIPVREPVERLADGLRGHGLAISHVEAPRPAKFFWEQPRPDDAFDEYLTQYHRIGRAYGLYLEAGLLSRDLWVRVPQVPPKLDGYWAFFIFRPRQRIHASNPEIVGSGPFAHGKPETLPKSKVQERFGESVSWRATGQGEDQ